MTATSISNPKKVMILDPSPIFRRTLKKVIQKSAAQVEISAAKDYDQAREILEQQPPDVVFFDIALPADNGINRIAAIKRLVPHSRVVVLTGHDSPEYESASLRNGADYFLSKERSSGMRLIEVIRATVDP
jgi:DNA-binding NarL/FixJ family response regulator